MITRRELNDRVRDRLADTYQSAIAEAAGVTRKAARGALNRLWRDGCARRRCEWRRAWPEGSPVEPQAAVAPKPPATLARLAALREDLLEWVATGDDSIFCRDYLADHYYQYYSADHHVERGCTPNPTKLPPHYIGPAGSRLQAAEIIQRDLARREVKA